MWLRIETLLLQKRPEDVHIALNLILWPFHLITKSTRFHNDFDFINTKISNNVSGPFLKLKNCLFLDALFYCILLNVFRHHMENVFYAAYIRTKGRYFKTDTPNISKCIKNRGCIQLSCKICFPQGLLLFCILYAVISPWVNNFTILLCI